MRRYAENTSVSVEKSKGEIEATLTRYGSTEFASGWKGSEAMIGFQIHEKYVRFTLSLPERKDQEFWQTPSGRARNCEERAYKAWEQACRQLWRALALCVKAKLEAVEAGITTFEHEFLAHIVGPDGRTVGDTVIPQLEKAYETGKVKQLLLPA